MGWRSIPTQADRRVKTKDLRQAIRTSGWRRGDRSKKFIDDWLKLKPDPSILEHYGHWPEPHLATYDKPFWGLYD